MTEMSCSICDRFATIYPVLPQTHRVPESLLSRAEGLQDSQGGGRSCASRNPAPAAPR